MEAADGVHSSLHEVPRASANNGGVQQRVNALPFSSPRQLPRGKNASPPPNPQRIRTRPHHPVMNVAKVL